MEGDARIDDGSSRLSLPQDDIRKRCALPNLISDKHAIQESLSQEYPFEWQAEIKTSSYQYQLNSRYSVSFRSKFGRSDSRQYGGRTTIDEKARTCLRRQITANPLQLDKKYDVVCVFDKLSSLHANS